MSFFEDIGYRVMQKERMRRLEREGRAGDSLGFTNRPDLNNPWAVPPLAPLAWVALALLAVVALVLMFVAVSKPM